MSEACRLTIKGAPREHVLYYIVLKKMSRHARGMATWHSVSFPFLGNHGYSHNQRCSVSKWILHCHGGWCFGEPIHTVPYQQKPTHCVTSHPHDKELDTLVQGLRFTTLYNSPSGHGGAKASSNTEPEMPTSQGNATPNKQPLQRISLWPKGCDGWHPGVCEATQLPY